MMKKILSTIVTSVILLAFLNACSSTPKEVPAAEQDAQTTETSSQKPVQNTTADVADEKTHEEESQEQEIPEEPQKIQPQTEENLEELVQMEELPPAILWQQPDEDKNDKAPTAENEPEVYDEPEKEQETTESVIQPEKIEISREDTVIQPQEISNTTETSQENNDFIAEEQEITQQNEESKDSELQNQENVQSAIEEEPKITPSRNVTVKTNQYLDVEYPGRGWIYIGELDKQSLFTYFGRKVSNANTAFSLRSKKNGETILHFYKNDPLTGDYIDDYLAVTVEADTAPANTRTKAPSYAEVVPPKQEKRKYQEPVLMENTVATEQSEQPKESPVATEKNIHKPKQTPQTRISQEVQKDDDKGVKTVIQNQNAQNSNIAEKNDLIIEQNKLDSIVKTDKEEKSRPAIPLADLLTEAKKSYAEKKYEEALTYVQSYLDSASSKLDEALFLQGQILEEESPVKNIRSAIDSYNLIVSKYPSSKYWKKANNRSIYLKRFYIDIR